MRDVAALSIVVASLLMLSCASPAPERMDTTGTKEARSAGDKRGRHAPGEVLVKFREGTGEESIKAIQERLKLKTIRIISKPDLYLMKIVDGSSVEEIIERLKAMPEVSHAEPNFTVEKHSEQPQTE